MSEELLLDEEEFDEEEFDSELIEQIEDVNENPVFKMEPPNDDCGHVNGLGSVIYGPPDALTKLYSVTKKFGYKSKEYNEHRSANPWHGVHVNGRPDIEHFQYIWNPYLVEDILYDNKDILEELYKSSIKNFKQAYRIQLSKCIKAVLIDNEDNIKTIIAPEKILPVSTDECKKSLVKALQYITDWLCACYCFEESFWMNQLQIIDFLGIKELTSKRIQFKFKGQVSSKMTQKEKVEETLHERMQRIRKDRAGKDRAGKDRAGKDRAGRERNKKSEIYFIFPT